MWQIKLLGVPSNVGCRPETAHSMDQHGGPTAIREAFKKLFAHYDIPKNYEDTGDVTCEQTVPRVLDAVQFKVREALEAGNVPVMLGGSHTVTLGALRAVASVNRPFSYIHIDAHPDLMPRPEVDYGSMLYHAFKEKTISPERVAFIGIRQVERPEMELIETLNIFSLDPIEFECHDTPDLVTEIVRRFPPPYYVSIDLDAFDPSIAPGVTSPFPGGLTVREVLYLAEELLKQGALGFDIVELSPSRDRDQQTALVAASLLQRLTNTVACGKRA